MYIIRNYTIPNAALQALSNGTGYWIAGANTQANQTPRLVQTTAPPQDYFDLSNYDWVKVYASCTALTTSTGGQLFMSEQWPDPAQTVATASGQAGSLAATALPAAAFTTVNDISQYSVATNIGGTSGTVYKFGRVGLFILFTTVPTGGGALNIIITGQRYGHEG